MRNLRSEIKTIEHVFALGYFRPASVQRNFQWDPERAERLLLEIQSQARIAADHGPAEEFPADTSAEIGTDDDIDETPFPSVAPESEASDDGVLADFYIGELVLHCYEENRYDIYDGLQRLTCLTILASVLRDLIEEPKLSERLDACIVRDETFRLAHPSFGRTLPEFVQRTGMARVQRKSATRPKDEVGQRVFDIQVRFAKMLGRYSQEQLSLVATHFLERVGATILTTGNPELARHIFVAKNLYGLPLSRDEVFKGQLLALAADEGEAAAIEETWNRVRDRVGVRDPDRKSPDSSVSEMERFLTALDVIWRKKPQSTDALGNLIDHLSKSQRQDRVRFMSALERYAYAWVRLHDYLDQPKGADGAIRNHVWRLQFFKWNEWMPLALHWIERFTALSSQKGMYGKTLRRFALLNRRCMAITLYEFGTHKRQEIFASAIGLTTRKKPTEPFGPSSATEPKPLEFSNRVRADVKNALRQPIENHEVRRTLLLWYEATLWDDEVPGHVMAGSVEHLLPDNPSPTSKWMTDFKDPDERYWAHGSLGNLVFVEFRLQEPLRNHDFEIKRPILAKEQQFEKFRCTSEIAAHPNNNWTAADIEARTAAMAERAWKSLQLPEPKS